MKRKGSVLSTLIIIIGVIAGLALLDYFFAFHTNSKNLYKGYSDSSSSGVTDENGIFRDDPAELERLSKIVRETSAKLDLNILIFLPDSTKKYYTDDDVRDFTANKYNDTFGEFTDGLLYYIDISGKSPACDDIAKSGKASLVYTEDICQNIFYALDEYLPPSYGPVYPEHITNAVEHFCSLLETNYSESRASEPYYDATANVPTYTYYRNGKTYITKSKPPLRKLLICMAAEAVGGLTALIIFLCTKGRYKFKNKTNPSIYLNNNDVHFIDNSDVLIRSYVTKHRIESSSGGGGSRGGGGGGGPSHGGSISHSSHHR